MSKAVFISDSEDIQCLVKAGYDIHSLKYLFYYGYYPSKLLHVIDDDRLKKAFKHMNPYNECKIYKEDHQSIWKLFMNDDRAIYYKDLLRYNGVSTQSMDWILRNKNAWSEEASLFSAIFAKEECLRWIIEHNLPYHSKTGWFLCLSNNIECIEKFWSIFIQDKLTIEDFIYSICFFERKEIKDYSVLEYMVKKFSCWIVPSISSTIVLDITKIRIRNNFLNFFTRSHSYFTSHNIKVALDTITIRSNLVDIIKIIHLGALVVNDKDIESIRQCQALYHEILSLNIVCKDIIDNIVMQYIF